MVRNVPLAWAPKQAESGAWNARTRLSVFGQAARRTRDCTFSDTARSRACRPCLAHRGSARAEALGDHFAGGLAPAAVRSPLVAEDGGPGWTSEQRVPGEIAVQRLCAPWATGAHPGADNGPQRPAGGAGGWSGGSAPLPDKSTAGPAQRPHPWRGARTCNAMVPLRSALQQPDVATSSR